MRYMSFMLTKRQFKERTKTVTRRHVDTWQTLKPGDRLTLIEKGMGLPKGARQVVLQQGQHVADAGLEGFLRVIEHRHHQVELGTHAELGLLHGTLAGLLD